MSKLIFVYNADAGLGNALLDSAHKLVSPSTYACSLCKATHGLLGKKSQWRAFVDGLDAEVEFLHRDEAAARYDVQGVRWPAVLQVKGDAAAGETAAVAVSAAQLDAVGGVEGLQRLVLAVLDENRDDISQTGN